jgi:DNA-directed RNA polymerase III subunit RPC4
MPPRPRGRGSTRARGGGRGGATTGRSTEPTGEATAVATPPETEAAGATEPPAQPIVVKQDDDDDDAKPPTTSENTPAPDDSQQPPSIDASYVNCLHCARSYANTLGSVQSPLLKMARDRLRALQCSGSAASTPHALHPQLCVVAPRFEARKAR